MPLQSVSTWWQLVTATPHMSKGSVVIQFSQKGWSQLGLEAFIHICDTPGHRYDRSCLNSLTSFIPVKHLHPVKASRESWIESMLRLQCTVQHYDWGKIGAKSEVGRLHVLASGDGIQDVPYAELWMGTHKSGPSLVMFESDTKGENRVPLKDWLDNHSETLGPKVLQRWNGELPFLFKVLSVAKALSIQAHPDKKLAKMLHEFQPHIYKDSNHKPEMALALTPFEALCGFVSSEELKQAIESVPELRSILGEETSQAVVAFGSNRDNVEGARPALKAAFTTLMTLPKDGVASTVSELITRLLKDKQVRQLTAKEELVLRLEKQYPADVGVLAIFFLNFVKLDRGEAMYLDANEPHAYISGEIVECMAASDNVVRAGFTPKYRDTQTLCSMLTYKQGLPEILPGTPISPFITRYTPPFDEFEVDHYCIPVGSSAELQSVGPSILLVFDGLGAVIEGGPNKIVGIKKGDTFFIPAGEKFEISATVEVDLASAEQQPLQLYRAGVNDRVYH